LLSPFCPTDHLARYPQAKIPKIWNELDSGLKLHGKAKLITNFISTKISQYGAFVCNRPDCINCTEILQLQTVNSNTTNIPDPEEEEEEKL
jgi:hypothetical protein